jgi:ABC-type multidrug transport system ATPase subunit
MISKRYGDLDVLSNVTFKVERGEFVVVWDLRVVVKPPSLK